MSNYSHLVTSNYVSVMNLDTGLVTKIMKDHPRFSVAVDFARKGDYESVEKLTVKNMVNNFVKDEKGMSISIEDGRVMFEHNGTKFELHNSMTDRILKMVDDGFDSKPFIAFMDNLMKNPSKTAIDELYLFLEATELPITSDGHFIAYKMVKNDYTSIYDGKFENKVGEIVEMPRNMVDDRRHNTCSQGLHFCSKSYLRVYGSQQQDSDRLLLVKINPADVVSIPSDYNNAKGRAAKYLIWKDITEPGWRAKYGISDYNQSSVEDDFNEDDDTTEDEVSQMLLDELRERLNSVPRCPECGSPNVYKKGFNNVHTKQRYKCNDCNTNFYKDLS